MDIPTPYQGIIVRCGQQDIYYAGSVNIALQTIASKRVGRSLLRSIVERNDRAQDGFTVVILKPKSHAMADDKTGKLITTWTNKAVRFSEDNACNGTGTRTSVSWNPNILTSPDGSRPPFIALAHELIHAMQNLRGTAFKDTKKEEYATVGLGDYANLRKRNENAIRAEHGVAPRTQYAGL